MSATAPGPKVDQDATLISYDYYTGRYARLQEKFERQTSGWHIKSGVPWRSAAFVVCFYPSSSSICAGFSAAFTLSIALTMTPFSSIR